MSIMIQKLKANMVNFHSILHEILFRDPIFNRHKVFKKTWDRYWSLTLNLDLLEDRDRFIARAAQVNINGRESVQEHIDKIFPDCSKRTSEYIMSGYVLKTGWEKKIHYYVMDKKISKLDDETIFILFSLNLRRHEILELSKLPKSYLAGFLPTKKVLV